MTLTDWIAIAAIVATLIVGIGGWLITLRKGNGAAQKQSVGKNGLGIQAGGDVRIGGNVESKVTDGRGAGSSDPK